MKARILITIIVFLFIFSFANAYKVSTHKALNKNILSEYSRLTHKAFPVDMMAVFVQAGADEDNIK